MSFETLSLIAFGFLFGLIAAVVAFKRVPRKLKINMFVSEWKKLQSYCRNNQTWPEALIAADKLLDKALKKRRYKGKTMGERLVAAQRIFTDNDDVWYAHNLVKKLKEDRNNPKLKESDVREALISFREALKDLGAFPHAN